MAVSPAVSWWILVLTHDICFILVLLLLVVFGRTTYKEYFSEQAKSKQAESQRRSKTRKNHGNFHSKLVIISVWSVGFIYGFNLMWMVSSMHLGRHFLSCTESVRVGSSTYQFAKCIMYGIFIQRISSVFSASSYAYSNYKLAAGYGVLFVLNSIVVVADTILPTGSFRKYGPNMMLCVIDFPPWMIGLAVLVDVIGSLTSLFLFVDPLIKMIEESSIGSSRNVPTRRKANLKMTRLAMKYTILTFLAVCTTVINLVVIGLFNQAFFSAMDMVVNLVVFALLTNWYDDYFYSYCQWTFSLLICCYHKNYLEQLRNTRRELDLSSTVGTQTESNMTPRSDNEFMQQHRNGKMDQELIQIDSHLEL